MFTSNMCMFALYSTTFFREINDDGEESINSLADFFRDGFQYLDLRDDRPAVRVSNHFPNGNKAEGKNGRSLCRPLKSRRFRLLPSRGAPYNAGSTSTTAPDVEHSSRGRDSCKVSFCDWTTHGFRVHARVRA